jgi:hypothetical protein
VFCLRQAIPDYVVTFAVEFSSDPQISSDLRMTYKEGYFELKSITPSRNVVTEESKLDDTLFRFAESQFHRMFSGAGLRFRVTKVDVVDNGDLNIRYRETKRRFEAEGKPLDELLVFHGTTGKNSRYMLSLIKRAYAWYCHCLSCVAACLLHVCSHPYV